MGRNLSLGRFSSSPVKKLSRLSLETPKSTRPSGKTNRPIVSADRWGSKSLATRCPTVRVSSSTSPLAIPLCQRSSSEEIAVTTTEKLDSSASSPFIVPSAEQPVRGAPPVISRTARTKECWSYPIEPNKKTKSGLSTPAFSSACSAASRPATLGLWCRLMPTPALVVMGVPPPARQEHLSLRKGVQHLSDELSLLTMRQRLVVCMHTGQCQRNPLCNDFFNRLAPYAKFAEFLF